MSNTPPPLPQSIRRLDDPAQGPGAIEIIWSDAVRSVYSPRLLREACPCATCRERRVEPAAKPALLQVLKPEEIAPLAITGMQPVGQYAYSIEFSDGHSSGIYTLEYLRELG
jgi:DUF971 family protein